MSQTIPAKIKTTDKAATNVTNCLVERNIEISL